MMEHESDFRTPADGEATLVSPRFDDSEARTASPVVPLSEVRAPRGAALSGALKNWRGFSLRRSWPLVALLICAMAAGVVGSAVYRHYSAPAAAAEQPAPQAEAAPVETTPARAAQTGTTRARPAARRAASQPARRDDGTGDAAALAGVALGNFFDGEKEDGKDERKERKRKDRAGKHGGDDDDERDERESRGRRRSKVSRGDAPRLVDVIKHD